MGTHAFHPGEYRTQTILGLFQAGAIIFGCLLTGVILKARGYPDQFHDLPFLLLFIRNWGFLLISIPLAWAAATIWLERTDDCSKRWTLASGLCLFALLVFFMIGIVGRAGSSLISTAPGNREAYLSGSHEKSSAFPP